MHGRRLAQMAAAMKTCIILHEAGELDNRLQPVGKELIKYDDEDCEWEEHELHGLARPGTTKRKQYYNKKVIGSFTVLLMCVCLAFICDADNVGKSLYHRHFFLVSLTKSAYNCIL